MAYLINRNPSGRIVCLHALLKYLNNRFKNNLFELKDLKFDINSDFNIHQTCTTLVRLPSIINPVCPFLENPLSRAKCYLTQSIQEDTQKSKSVSDAFNALEGLGFIKRKGNKGILSKLGEKFARNDYFSEESFNIIKSSLLSYGPFVGFLSKVLELKDMFRKTEINIGYPTTSETIYKNGELIRLSTGSQKDTITRTRSVLIVWAITGGYIEPAQNLSFDSKKLPHNRFLPYIKSKKWTHSTFKISSNKDIFNSKIFVANPLSYDSMTKNTRALRERNQESIRSTSLQYEEIIKNRRFAIVYILLKFSDLQRGLEYENFIKNLLKYPNLFVINSDSFGDVMYEELEIATIAGIPFEYKNNLLLPKTKMNLNNLTYKAEASLLKVLDNIILRLLDE